MPLLLVVLLFIFSLSHARAKSDSFKISPRANGVFSGSRSVTTHTSAPPGAVDRTSAALSRVFSSGCANQDSVPAYSAFEDDRCSLVGRFQLQTVRGLINYGLLADSAKTDIIDLA